MKENNSLISQIVKNNEEIEAIAFDRMVKKQTDLETLQESNSAEQVANSVKERVRR
jgi:hypothetical protein